MPTCTALLYLSFSLVRVKTKEKRMPHFLLFLDFFATSPIRTLISADMCFASHSHRWCGKDFFPNFYATTRNRTHVGSIASLWGTFQLDALPTKLHLPFLLSLFKQVPYFLFFRIGCAVRWINKLTQILS